MYSLTKSCCGIYVPMSSKTLSYRSTHACQNGPNTLTSNGWSLWVVWGDKDNKMILLFTASWCIGCVSCDPWPSYMSRIGLPYKLWAVACRINDFWNHSIHKKSSVYPLGEVDTLPRNVISLISSDIANLGYTRSQDALWTIQGRIPFPERQSQGGGLYHLQTPIQ